ncbi:MAG: hypothetical protein EOP52_00725 [Sphingobacteriales bacterium]|nr:MAG: hypothetical protein EOP52_00725 [Sphingobacteriales bacterium]
MTTAVVPEANRPRQVKALALTLGIHALLALLFFGIRYAAPQPVSPPAEELGMEVNLGSSADGYGTEQPEIMGDPAPETPVTAPASGTPEEATEPITASPSNDPDATEITPKKETLQATKPKPTTPKTTPTRIPTVATTPAATKPSEAPRKAKVLFPGSTGTGGNGAQRDVAGGNEGNTFGNGDRGVPGGTPGAKNYEGSPGRGTGGVNHTLSGRTILAPRLEGNFRNGGTVKMRVTVNRAGAIVSSSVLSGSGELVPIAKDKLQQVRFSAAPEGPVEQFGTVTFVFKTGG